MIKVQTSLRQEGDALFIRVQWFMGTETARGVSWATGNHKDINLSCEYGQHSLCGLVSDGIITPDEAAEIRVRLDSLRGAA